MLYGLCLTMLVAPIFLSMMITAKKRGHAIGLGVIPSWLVAWIGELKDSTDRPYQLMSDEQSRKLMRHGCTGVMSEDTLGGCSSDLHDFRPRTRKLTEASATSQPRSGDFGLTFRKWLGECEWTSTQPSLKS